MSSPALPGGPHVQVEIKRAVKKEEMAGGGMPPMGMGGGGGGGGGYAPGAGGPLRAGKEPDWICPDTNCRNKNFGWRQACNRCQVCARIAAAAVLGDQAIQHACL